VHQSWFNALKVKTGTSQKPAQVYFLFHVNASYNTPGDQFHSLHRSIGVHGNLL